MPPPDSLRLTVLGCSTAAPHTGVAGRRDTSSSGATTALHARRRAGHHPPPAARARPARPERDRHRPHARRPLPGPRRPALPLRVGRGDPGAAPRLGAARRPRPARSPGERDLGAGRLLRRRLRCRRVRPGPCRSRSVPLVVRFIQAQHYVPAWGVVVEAPERRPARLHRRHRPERDRGGRRARRRPAARRGGAPADLTRRPAARPPDAGGGHRTWPSAPRPRRPCSSTTSRHGARRSRRCAPRRGRGSGPPSPA